MRAIRKRQLKRSALAENPDLTIAQLRRIKKDYREGRTLLSSIVLRPRSQKRHYGKRGGESEDTFDVRDKSGWASGKQKRAGNFATKARG